MPGGNFHALVGDQAINAKQRIDYANATTIYIGFGAPGALEANPAWQIRRQTLDGSGRTTEINFAGGTVAYEQIWNNRTTLNYS